MTINNFLNPANMTAAERQLGNAPELGKMRAPPVAQDGVMVTRAMLTEAMAKLPFRNVTSAELADALGIPPEPPKVAPWEAAYEAWTSGGSLYDERGTWQAAVEWMLGQSEKCMGINSIGKGELRLKIMGETE